MDFIGHFVNGDKGKLYLAFNGRRMRVVESPSDPSIKGYNSFNKAMDAVNRFLNTNMKQGNPIDVNPTFVSACGRDTAIKYHKS